MRAAVISSFGQPPDAGEVTPPEGGAAEDGSGECQVLGAGAAFGFFADVDGGAADVVTIQPPYPATTGTRGQGAWAGPGGAGINA